MLFQSDRRVWRWLALAATLANVAFNGVAQRLHLGTGSIREITRQHAALFTPADYAFAIWGLIYCATLAYCFYQLSPSQRHVDAHDRIAKPLIAINLLASAWIVVFQYELIGWSVFVIAAALATGALLYVRVGSAVAGQEVGGGVLAFASLWFAWLSVATIADVAIWMAAANAYAGFEVTWTVAAIAIATLLGFVVGRRVHDWTYPLVVAWALSAIGVERRMDDPVVALVASVAAFAMVAWSIHRALQARRPRRGFRIFRGPLDA